MCVSAVGRCGLCVYMCIICVSLYVDEVRLREVTLLSKVTSFSGWQIQAW